MARWDFLSVVTEAAKYPTRTKFARLSRGAYEAAQDQGLLDQLFPITPRSKWNDQSVREEAAKYSTRQLFNIRSRGAYNVASALGLLNELFPIQPKVKKIKAYNPSPARPAVVSRLTLDNFDPEPHHHKALNTLEDTGDTFTFYKWLGAQPVEYRDVLLQLAKKENPGLF